MLHECSQNANEHITMVDDYYWMVCCAWGRSTYQDGLPRAGAAPPTIHPDALRLAAHVAGSKL